MKTRLLVAAGAAALVLSPLAAGAGELQDADMVVTPSPAFVGDTMTVTNAANADSTCIDGDIHYLVTGPDATTFAEGGTTPDGSGNWSFQFVPDEAGEWEIEAECYGAQPGAFPDFTYNGVFVIVQAPGTTVPTTAAPTTAAPTTTAAAAATVTPAFTG